MAHHRVSDVMTAQVAAVAEDTPFKELAVIMADRRVSDDTPARPGLPT